MHHPRSILLAALLFAAPAFAGSSGDGYITSRAKLSLWTTAGVKSTAVHVDTNDGVVTLYGKVLSEGQKRLADQAARDVPGVRNVVNLLQVVAEKDEKRVEHSDKDLKAAIEKQLKADPALKDSSVVVKSVDKGTVLLAGDARTFSDKLRAITVTDRVPGVWKVSSEIASPDEFGAEERLALAQEKERAAKGATRSSASDMRISAAVKFQLFTAADLPSTEINVDTYDGVVTLFGIVPTEGVKAAASKLSRGVSGVKSVQNQLEVVPSAEKKVVEAKDADIERDLKLAVKSRPDLSGVSFEVKNGLVRVSGIVQSDWELLSALRLTRQVHGVRAVQSDLRVEEPAVR
jgi:hyperosmotically inducible protein